MIQPGGNAMAQQRISYVDPGAIRDPAMLAELDRCRREGTPRPESQAVRAHVPAVFWAFANAWRDTFRNGVMDHGIKELCRVYVSRSVKCDYCGNQRSEKSRNAGMVEDDYRDLLNFEKSKHYDERQKAALAYTEAITWDLETDDALWARLKTHFSEPEIVELGFFVALTMGQQRWLRTLNIEHHQILPGTAASMAPGFETPEAQARSKSAEDYWAKRRPAPARSAAE
jgi:alkylhydroperoxidase family enzyme